MLRLTFAYILVLAATAGLVLSLNALDAGVGVSVAVFGLFAVAIGFAIGYFVDQIPDFFISRQRRGAPRYR